MSKQELVELQKIVKILKKQREPIKEARKRAKKIKLKDLLKPENLTERINNFLDKMTADDLMSGVAIISIAMILKSGLDWSEDALNNMAIFPGGLIYRPDIPPVEERPGFTALFNLNPQDWKKWLISLGLAYIIVEHFDALVTAGSNILSVGRRLLGALTK